MPKGAAAMRLFSYTRPPGAANPGKRHPAAGARPLDHAPSGAGKGQDMADEEKSDFTPITSQEQLDGILKGRLAREREKVKGQYADYDDLKAAAAKYREIQDAEKSDLQKANERIAELEASAKKRDEADRIRDLKGKVSKATGVPVDLIQGTDEESMTSFAFWRSVDPIGNQTCHG